MEALKQELKERIVNVLNLEDITPADIQDNDALFGDGLGLDSIDALELIVLLDKEYGIKLSDPKQGKDIFSLLKLWRNTSLKTEQNCKNVYKSIQCQKSCNYRNGIISSIGTTVEENFAALTSKKSGITDIELITAVILMKLKWAK